MIRVIIMIGMIKMNDRPPIKVITKIIKIQVQTMGKRKK